MLHATFWVAANVHLLMRAARPQGISGAMNPYGITLKPAWTEWAAKLGVSETIAAAVYLLSENRKAEEVVGKLDPSEIEQVIDIIGHQPTAFPRGFSHHLGSAAPSLDRFGEGSDGRGDLRARDDG